MGTVLQFAYLPLMSGGGICICRSNLPGLNRAGSRTSGLFVPDNTTTLVDELKPKTKTFNWLFSTQAELRTGSRAMGAFHLVRWAVRTLQDERLRWLTLTFTVRDG